VGGTQEPEHLDVGNTPLRVARALLEETLGSYRPGALGDLRKRFTTFPTAGAEEMVTLGPIPFSSTCAHHMMPFVGEAFVGYIPEAHLVGLSKIPRTVKHFSRKLQTQERLTMEIADFLQEELAPKGVIVLMKARHFCMEARGVECAGVITRTSALRGIAMTDPDVKLEFYRLLDP
jgi:GTP cyclohydrolase I